MWNTFILDPMINALLFLYQLLGHNFALAIIMFTVLIRLLTFPLTYQQQKSTQKQQKLMQSKEWQEVQKKHAKDREKLASEQMRMYREAGANPLGGCLPTLIQLPILIGLYQAIMRTLGASPLQLIDLTRQIYDFFPNATSLIPIDNHFLWMNLAQPERLYLPFLPDFGIPVLAILVLVTTWFSQKLITPPSADAQGAQMTRMMNLYMPVLLGYFALTFSSGLSVYFVVSNLLAIGQYALMGKVDWRRALGLKPAIKAVK